MIQIQTILLLILLASVTVSAQEPEGSVATRHDSTTDQVRLNDKEILDRILLLAQVVDGPEAIAAVQDLAEHFDQGATPADVSRVAGNVMVQTSSPKIRVLAARLFSAGPEPLDVRARRLMHVIAAVPRDYDLDKICVDMFTPDRLQEFVLRYGADSSLPRSVRDLGIRRLGDAVAPGQSLSDEVQAALRAAAMTPGINDRQIDRTLEVWGEKPLTDTFRLQEEATFKFWLTVWLVVVFLLGPSAFFAVLYFSSRFSDNSGLKNLGGWWTVFTGVYFLFGVLFILALYGFGMSHGAGTSRNADTITFWIPVLYLAISLIWGLAAVMAKRSAR